MGLTFAAVLLCFISFAVCSCPDGWASHGCSCYHFSHDKEDWINAREVCKILGGDLTEINDADKGTFLSTKVKTLNGSAFWIALTDLEKEGEFVWVASNTHLTSSSYTYWSLQQPNNFVEGENCVVIGYTGKWFDDVCSDIRHYICEKHTTAKGFADSIWATSREKGHSDISYSAAPDQPPRH